MEPWQGKQWLSIKCGIWFLPVVLSVTLRDYEVFPASQCPLPWSAEALGVLRQQVPYKAVFSVLWVMLISPTLDPLGHGSRLVLRDEDLGGEPEYFFKLRKREAYSESFRAFADSLCLIPAQTQIQREYLYSVPASPLLCSSGIL